MVKGLVKFAAQNPVQIFKEEKSGRKWAWTHTYVEKLARGTISALPQRVSKIVITARLIPVEPLKQTFT